MSALLCIESFCVVFPASCFGLLLSSSFKCNSSDVLVPEKFPFLEQIKIELFSYSENHVYFIISFVINMLLVIHLFHLTFIFLIN